jgi:dihydroorotate dehydrogenase electron transfer subunit
MTIAIVKQNKQISEGIYLLTLYAPMVSEASHPGQFLNVYLEDNDLILPRPISIAGAEGGEVSLIYAEVGEGTRRMTFLSIGDNVRILGPLGNGFNIDNISAIHDEVICIGGGLGIPSIDYTARHCERSAAIQKMRHCESQSDASIRKMCHCGLDPQSSASYNVKQNSLTTIFGYRNEAWLPPRHCGPRAAISAISEHDKSVSGDLGITGNVIDLLNIHEFTGKNPIILSCGPIPMLKAVQEFATARNIKTKLSLEARMGCGYGACVGCTISLKEKNEIAGHTLKSPRARNDARRKICADGPVFDGEEIIWESLM